MMFIKHSLLSGSGAEMSLKYRFRFLALLGPSSQSLGVFFSKFLVKCLNEGLCICIYLFVSAQRNKQFLAEVFLRMSVEARRRHGSISVVIFAAGEVKGNNNMVV